MIQCFVIHRGKLRTDLDLPSILEATRPRDVFGWVDLECPTEEELALLGKHLGVHDLTLEDIREAEGRPRVETFSDHVFLILKALNFNAQRDVLDAINVNCILFKDFLVTAHDEPVRVIRDVIDRLGRDPTRFKRGPSSILYHVLDGLVDRYFEMAEELEEALEALEPKVMGDVDAELPDRLYEWKRRIIRIRRRFGAHRDVLLGLASSTHEVLPPSEQVYFRDVLDRVMRIEDRLVSYRELIQGANDLYLAGAAQQTNEVMKTLSIVATIVLPLNILTGLYGTNFKVLPGSEDEAAFWVFVGSLLTLAVLTAGYFRWRRWL